MKKQRYTQGFRLGDIRSLCYQWQLQSNTNH